MAQEILASSQSREMNRQTAVNLTLAVRDVPYSLGSDGNTEGLLSEGIGGCARKHFYLMPRLQSLGYKVSLGVAKFDWRELPIPKNILSLLKEPVQTHLFLYFGLDKPKHGLDVTWDKGMKSLGFPVFDWDGFSRTGIVVTPIYGSIRKINPLILSIRSLASSNLQKLLGQADKPTPFNDAFNKWLSKVRNQ